MELVTLAVVGVATTSGFSQAVLTVLDVYDNTGDVIKISGVTSATATDYNQLYRITGISTAKEIQVSSASTVSVPSTSGLVLILHPSLLDILQVKH